MKFNYPKHLERLWHSLHYLLPLKSKKSFLGFVLKYFLGISLQKALNYFYIPQLWCHSAIQTHLAAGPIQIGQTIFTDFVLILLSIRITSNIYDFTHGLYFSHEHPISLIYMLPLDIDPRRTGMGASRCQYELSHNIRLMFINSSS